MLQCYAELDYDLGANAPAELVVEGKRLLALPGKDGALYLLDGDHLGRLYDRYVALPPCGTPGDLCQLDWAGMFVTQPLVHEVDGKALVLVAGFMPDRTQPAGLFALQVEKQDEGYRWVPRWVAPPPTSDDALRHFRRHDGALLAKREMRGAGQRYVRPLALGQMLVLSSCAAMRQKDAEDAKIFLEAYRIRL